MLDLILDSLRVVSLPTKTNFRGINQREVALFQGSEGWAEFSPFLESVSYTHLTLPTKRIV